ncbi:hypothetical protein CGRA01v4_13492 [Colletotrichum graminicola]|nr:hypothetical protein CGRA01v4_13492 [Colletotrichum graminicola]
MITERLPTLPASLRPSDTSISALLLLVCKSRCQIAGTRWTWLLCARARGDGMASFEHLGPVIAKSGVQDSQSVTPWNTQLGWPPSVTEAGVAFPDSPWSNSFRRRIETAGGK